MFRAPPLDTSLGTVGAPDRLPSRSCAEVELESGLDAGRTPFAYAVTPTPANAATAATATIALARKTDIPVAILPAVCRTDVAADTHRTSGSDASAFDRTSCARSASDWTSNRW